MEPAHIQYIVRHHRGDVVRAVLALWRKATELVWRSAFKCQKAYRHGDVVMVYDWISQKLVTIYTVGEELPR